LAQFDANCGVLHNQVAQGAIRKHPVVHGRDCLRGHILGGGAKERCISQNAARAERGQRLAALGGHAHKTLFQQEETARWITSAEECAPVGYLPLGETFAQLFALGIRKPGKKRRKA